MTETPSAEQRLAADPRVSAWVGANAGSGKTRVLTERVARLLLAGAAPGKILCLTYTTAAAAEMQTRLFQMLGSWSMQADADLARLLGALRGSAPVEDPPQLARARQLLARALETPGGLKIQTIHAFCTELLRRFPLEAGVSPSFEVIEERQARLILGDLRQQMAEAAEKGEESAFDLIAGRLNEGDVDGLIAAVLPRRDQLDAGDIEARLAAHFGKAATGTLGEVAAEALSGIDRGRLADLAALLSQGSANEKKRGPGLLAVGALLDTAPFAAGKALIKGVLTQAGAAPKNMPTKKTVQDHPWTAAAYAALAEAALQLQDRLNAHEAARRARDLHSFGAALLTRYHRAKAGRALLDFDDLIARTRDLLTRSELGAWALYKLDQGIDHVLVDEAQDTSPAQWAVIEAITEDFYSGAGARDAGLERTVFVVGDEKQSIYSFQGAEPQAFGATRARYEARLSGVGKRLERPGLITSYRSAPGILEFVDRVFTGDAAEGLTVDATPPRHRAHRAGDTARIDLWPLIEPAEKPEQPPWYAPVDTIPPDHPKLRLAAVLAREIRRMIAEDRLPPRAGDTAPRPVRAGDILVLVRRRDQLARGLIRNLKSLGVPVAGADRLSLGGELAVRDLMALIKVMLMPGDDLSLACVLRSPLCSIGEEQLFTLAHGRQGSLWQRVMEDPGSANEAGMLRDLQARAGFQPPFEFLESVLIHHDGRRRLLARLGPEAEDPIDELLAQALSYEARETPTLAGFIDWIEAAHIQIKREMEKGADQVRVMTVHGAKGLEAPVVILPDTVSAAGPSNRQRILMAQAAGNAGGLALWPGAKSADDAVIAKARAAAEAREMAEARRLLYVGLTRAEDWLILCGAGSTAQAEKAWYGLLSRAFDGAETQDLPPLADVPGPIRRIGDGSAAPAASQHATAAEAIPPKPDWLASAPREDRPMRLRPSHLAPGEVTGGEGVGRMRALARGNAVHLLLERLPGQPAADRDGLGRRLLASDLPTLDPDMAREALAEALDVLDAPAAQDLFAPGTLGEVAVKITLDGVPMLGRIDRLVISPARALIVDFKTDPQVPETPEAVSAAYIAQLSAYRVAIKEIHPDLPVHCAILWTRNTQLMEVPAPLLDHALDAVADLRSERD